MLRIIVSPLIYIFLLTYLLPTYLSTYPPTYIITHSLTPWSRVYLEKLTGLQLVKKFLAFCGTWRFITAFTSAHHLSLSWASSIHSMPPHPTSWRFIIMLSSHLCLGLPSGLLPSGFPTKTLYMPVLSSIHTTCPTHLTLLDCTTWAILGDEHRSHILTYVYF